MSENPNANVSGNGNNQTQTENQNNNDDNTDTNNNANDNNNPFPDASQLRCPVDLSCLWQVPMSAFSNWVSWTASLAGQNPRGVNIVHERLSPTSSKTKYVRLSTGHSTGALDDGEEDSSCITAEQIAAATHRKHHKNKSRHGVDSSSSSPIFVVSSPRSSPLKISAEFEIWQKYLRDLSNFAAIDVDVSFVVSSNDNIVGFASGASASSNSNGNPYLQVTIRGPILPSLGRCRRHLENETNDTSSFIAPTTLDEWQEANPVRILEVVEAFLLAVLAPAEDAAEDDTIQGILETGTHILAMPAPALQDFLGSVSTFLKSNSIGVKLVVRDIDFAESEFDSARETNADQFLVLDTTDENFPKAREPKKSNSMMNSALSTIFHSASSTTQSSSTEEQDFGSCPKSARVNFENDYSMLDIVRVMRNFIRRLFTTVSQLKVVELRGCLLRDNDLDVGGLFVGISSKFLVVKKKNKNDKSGDDDDNNDENDDEENNQQNNEQNSDSGDFNDDDYAFQTRPGNIASTPKRIEGPSKLIIEHCALSDAHLSALCRLLRVETEKIRRENPLFLTAGSSNNSNKNSTETAKQTHRISSHNDGNKKSNPLLVAPMIASLDSIRLSGQFYPMAVVGLVSAMHDTWEDAKTSWVKRCNVVIRQRKHHSHSKNNNENNEEDEEEEMIAEEEQVRFPLRELEVPSSAIHTVRNAIDSRGLSATVTTRSIE